MVVPNAVLQVAPCADLHVVISLNETVREIQTAKCILFLKTAFLVLSPIIKRFGITRGGGIPRVWMYKVTRTVVEPRILSHRYSGSQKS